MRFRNDWKPGDLGHAAEHNKIGARLNTCYVASPGDNLQDLIDELHQSGGGRLHLGAGDYPTAAPIWLYDNITITGDGYSTFVHNTATAGFAKCTFIAGNIGGPLNDPTGALAETYYPIADTIAGTNTITLTDPADAARFAANDTVFLRSTELWKSDIPKYCQPNIVRSVEGATVTLKYPIPDSYAGSVAKLTGTLDGGGGRKQYMPRNVSISNLRLGQAIVAGSGYYALALSCLDSKFSSLWLDPVSKGVGANWASYNHFDNIHMQFQSTPADFAHGCCANQCRQFTMTKSHPETVINDIGFCFHEAGSDNLLDGFSLSMLGAGQSGSGLSTDSNHRSAFINGAVMTSCLNGVLLGGIDCRVSGVSVIRPGTNGIFVAGTGGMVHNCRVYDTPVPTNAIRIGLAASGYRIAENLCR